MSDFFEKAYHAEKLKNKALRKVIKEYKTSNKFIFGKNRVTRQKLISKMTDKEIMEHLEEITKVNMSKGQLKREFQKRGLSWPKEPTNEFGD